MLYHLYTLDKNSENRHIRSLSHVKMNGAGSMGAKRLLLLLT